MEIPKYYFNLKEITKEGNCLFRDIIKYYLGDESQHFYFRNIIYNYILQNKNNQIFKLQYIQDNNNIIEIWDYLDKIKKDVHLLEN